METLYLLVPLALLFALALGVALLWAVQTGQYDDLDRPARDLLLDDD